MDADKPTRLVIAIEPLADPHASELLLAVPPGEGWTEIVIRMVERTSRGGTRLAVEAPRRVSIQRRPATRDVVIIERRKV
jgi:hypothetical protein